MALSSAEAKLHAAISTICEATGVKFPGRHSGEHARIVVLAGAHATKGLSFRSGFGKARHIEIAEQ